MDASQMRPADPGRRLLGRWDVGLLFAYLFFHVPRLFYISNFSAAICPLLCLYVAKTAIGGGLNPALTSACISPANVILILPPGSWLAALWLGSVRNMYLFLFLLQIPVPLLLFRLLRRHVPESIAGLLSLLAAYHCVDVNWWSPDWMVQPFLLAAILLIQADETGKSLSARYAAAGVFTGLTMVFKHNIGLFLAVACMVHIWLCCLRPGDGPNGWSGHLLRWIPPLGCVAFAFFFACRLLYPDELVYYVVPCVLFWSGILLWLHRDRRIQVHPVRWMRLTAAFLAGWAPLPLAAFAWMSAGVGAGRYFRALFGMGLKFLPIWDRGILQTMASYLPHISDLSPRGLVRSYHTTAILLMFVLPLLAGFLAALWTLRRARGPVADASRSFTRLPDISLGVMGTFMLFPLEARHILATKVFLSVWILCILGSDRVHAGCRRYVILLLALLLPALVPAVGRAIRFHPRGQLGSQELKRVIGIPMEPQAAKGLLGQVETINRSVRGEPYYLIESRGATLASLLPLADNRMRQLYLELRDGILDEESASAVQESLLQAPHVVVSEEDFQRHRSGRVANRFFAGILALVDERYVTVDRYVPPDDLSPSQQILGFRVMSRKGRTTHR